MMCLPPLILDYLDKDASRGPWRTFTDIEMDRVLSRMLIQHGGKKTEGTPHPSH